MVALLNTYCKCMSVGSLMFCSQCYIGSYRLALRVWLDHLHFSELHSYRTLVCFGVCTCVLALSVWCTIII